MSHSLHPPPDRLVAYGQGRLSDLEAETVEGHLADCTECQLQLDTIPDDAVVSLVKAVLPARGPGASAATRTEYRDLTFFARGGLGEVLIARDTVVGRDVAVKRLLPHNYDHPDRRKRFLREAAVTGRLEHPGVAPVYGVGQDEAGRPCYAMRFVPGKTLQDAVLELHAAGPVTAAALRPLLARFAALCATVAYAHSRGVVHRDIKPANVAVGAFGETILLDWGLAQTDDEPAKFEAGGWRPDAGVETSEVGLQGSEAADPSLTLDFRPATAVAEPAHAFDQFHTAPGTILGTPGFMAPEQYAGERVGPAADVYSLGVTLRAILTGRGPTESPIADPPFPALMAVVDRATAPEPAARYPDALELAADIERWLADEPVSAYPDPPAVRVRRFVRRHQTASAAAVVLLMAVAVSLGIGAALLDREQRKTVAALVAESEQREKAVAKEAETAAVLGYVEQQVFAAGRPKGRDGGLGRDVKLADAVAAAARQVDSSFPGQPLTQARVQTMLGMTLLHLGDAKAAEWQFAAARHLFQAHRGPDDPDTLRNIHNLATSYRDQGRYKEALELDVSVADRRKASLGPDHPDTLRSLHNLANSYSALGRWEEALRLDKDVYARRLATLGPDHGDTIMSMASLASSHASLLQHAEALPLREEVLKWYRGKFGTDDAGTILAMNNLANTYGDLGRHDEALALREEAVALIRGNVGPDHADTLTAMNNLASSYRTLKRWEEALRLNREVLALRRAKLTADHPDTLISMYSVANTLLDMGRGDEAIVQFDEVLRRAAGKPVNPRLVPAILERQIRYYAGRNDAAACRASAQRWDKLVNDSAEFLAHAAQLWSMTSKVQARAPGPDAGRLARDDADRAMAWLAKAVAAGYKDRDALEKGADFDALRGRDDFQKLLAEVKVLP